MTMSVGDSMRERLDEMKPRLRGWLHLGAFPLAVAAGIVLVVLSPAGQPRVGSAIFATTSAMLFGVSALFHLGHWSPRWYAWLRRLDHSSIFLLIAGTYTPFALLLLDQRDAAILLGIVWVGAVIGIAFRVLWISAPRRAYLPVYIALGWVAVFWVGDFAHSAGPAVLTLIVVGGLFYSAGGVVYGIKRPNPLPRWFGFHEVFHSCTIVAFVVHYVGVSIATYSLH
ncbi:MAG: hemolysin III family protein [Nocardioidaceae bacterium]